MYKGGGTQHIDDVIVHVHRDYQVAAALRFEIFMKFLSWLFSGKFISFSKLNKFINVQYK